MRCVAFCQTMRRFLPCCHFEDNNWISQLAYLVEPQSARQGHYDFKNFVTELVVFSRKRSYGRDCVQRAILAVFLSLTALS